MIARNLALIFLSILASFTLLPILLIIILPLSLVRKCAINIAKKRGWIPLSIHSCAIVTDDIYGKPRANYQISMLSEGPIFESQLRSRIQAVVDNQTKWPELTMNLVRWMGTYFWEPCPIFNFDDHISFDRKCRTSADFHETCQKELFIPFVKGKPLWKFIAFPNYQDPEKNVKSALVLKLHHTLADGFAVSKLLQDVMDPNPDVDMAYDKVLSSVKHKMRMSGWRKLMLLLQLIFITPTETFYMIFDGALQSNSWKIPFKKQAKTVTVSCNFNCFDISWLKKIAKNCDQSVTTVIFDAVTMAMCRCMGGPERDFTVAYPLPNLSHPGTLTNCLTPMMMKAPVSTKNTRLRQNQIAEQFRYKTSTAFPFGILAAAYAECLLSSFFNREFEEGNVTWTCGMFSNFVLNFGQPFHLFNSKVVSIAALPGLQRRFNSVFVITLSYNGKLTIVVSADKNVLQDDKEAQKFLSCINEEFKACEGNKND